MRFDCTARPSGFGVNQQKAQGHEDAPRVLAVPGHAEPVSGLLAAHLLDAFGAGAHVLAVAHGSEDAEQEAQVQGKVLVQGKGLALPDQGAAGLDAGCR